MIKKLFWTSKNLTPSLHPKSYKTFFREFLSIVLFFSFIGVVSYFFFDLLVLGFMNEDNIFKIWREGEIWFLSLFDVLAKPSLWLPLLLITTLASGLSWGVTRVTWTKRIFFPSVKIFFSLFLAQAVVYILKGLVGRARPYTVNLGYEENMFKPLVYFLKTNRDFASFPSGHTATIFAVLYAFYIIFPKLNQGVFFLLLSFLIASQRIITLNHYPSDVVFGALIGVLTAHTVDFVFSRLGNSNFIKSKLQSRG